MTPSTPADVIVVGAGFAGLRTAELLRDAGHVVIVLEGGSRVGGRVRTVTAPFGGEVIETGAEWVDENHRRVYELMDRFGVRPEGDGQTWGMIRRWLYDGIQSWSGPELVDRFPAVAQDLERYEAAVSAVADGIADASRPQDHPEARVHDARSMAEVIDELGLCDYARLFAHRDSQGEFASEPGDVSLLFVAQQRAMQRELAAGEVVKAHRVVGGFSPLAEGMARGLDVRFGQSVEQVSIGEDGVEVATATDRFRAGHVVLTASVPATRRITFDPPLAAPLATAIAELGFGTVTKNAVQFPARTWPAGYATTTDVIQRVYEPTIDRAGTTGVLMAYVGGDGGRALAERPEADRIAHVLDGMRRLFDGLPDPIGATSRAWSAEARFGGAYACYGPGQVCAFWDVLRSDHGRLVLAGEHTATVTGYLEGALESAERAAARIAGD